MNNGVCLEAFNSFSCTCLPGFTGPTCALSINYCASFPCYTGTCVNNATMGTYTCECPTGFYGQNCQNSTNSCTSSPCYNGGSCYQLAAGGYTCVCDNGYTGINCKDTIDYCNSNPCKNNAVCVSALANLVCVCPFGVTGQFCDICNFTSEPYMLF